MEPPASSSTGADETQIHLAELNGHADESAPLLNPDSKEKEKVIFEPDDPSMARYSKFGVWDFWEDVTVTPTAFFNLKLPHTIAAKIKVPRDVYRGWPYVQRMLADMATVEGSKMYFTVYLVLRLVGSVMPSLEIWYNSQLLRMIETAVETRSVDKDALLRIAACQVAVSLAQRVLDNIGEYFDDRFDKQVTRKFALRAFQLAARLDVPTHGDTAVQESIDNMWYYDNPLTRAARSVVQLLSDVVNFATQCGVLINVLQGHYEGARFLIVVGFLRLLYDIACESTFHRIKRRTGWALKTTDEDFLQKSGLQSMVTADSYRKDLVAGGLGEFLSRQFDRRVRNLGDKPTEANHVHQARGLKRAWQLLLGHAQGPFDVFCQIYTCLQVVNSPLSTPFSLSTLHLVTSTVSALNTQLSTLGRNIEGISDDVEQICKYYKTLDMPNRIQDGTIPFPENDFDLANGISVEFRDVSFKYPDGTGQNVIKNLSFKVEQGQLCVIVGENGSGKSTILTLLTRIYDVTEGQILLNGYDIRTLRLADVRKAVAVLFQEYNIFPLPFAQNIGLGDPENSEDMDNIRQAAHLGGAEEFIEALPKKYETYLSRPECDHWDPEPSKHSAY